MTTSKSYIDLRSDTVTHPTEEMRTAMASAIVGDDVYGEDPTVNLLEQKSAELLGKEDALFVTSGTMGNLLAILVECERGEEAIMGSSGHTFLHEVGGMSALGGVFANILPNEKDGTIIPDLIKAAVRGADVHEPLSKMLIIENTQNQCGGIPISVEYMEEVGAIAQENDLFLHIDGARLFNASTALGCDPKDLVSMAGSVTFCLSKGLCAPVGSMLCGPKDFIAKARKYRKMLGGGMRQAGILAAAGIIAIEKMIDRLPEDHRHAAELAEQISKLQGFSLSKGMPQSNMVFLKVDRNIFPDLEDLESHFERENVLIGFSGPSEIRLVCHYWISDDDVKHVISSWRSLSDNS